MTRQELLHIMDDEMERALLLQRIANNKLRLVEKTKMKDFVFNCCDWLKEPIREDIVEYLEYGPDTEELFHSYFSLLIEEDAPQAEIDDFWASIVHSYIISLRTLKEVFLNNAAE